MFNRVILDDDHFRVTLGPLGGVTATLKWRGLSRKFTSGEAAFLKAALDEYQRLGGCLAPDSAPANHIIGECAEAVISQGAMWQRVFIRTSPQEMAAEAMRGGF